MVEYCYVHIPFCRKKCKYCAFTSFINLNFTEKYINSLLIEIDSRYKKEKLKTLYIGGGTPSLLKMEEISRIVKKFNFKDSAELTIEVNPEDANYDYFKKLLSIGFNRLSIGAQTFNQKILNEIGRNHSIKEIFNAVREAQKAGFNNISVDLMYGLANQNINNFISDIETVKKLNIQHVSTYGLKIEDKTYYKKFPPKNLPDENRQAKMYEICVEMLNKAGFLHYEISNFAKGEKYISKHNLNYWNLNPYYGFGVSSSGFENNIRYKNTENIKKYLENPYLKEEEYKLGEKELLEEKIFLGFRKKEGVKANLVEENFGKILEKYQKSGHIIKENGQYRLTVKGILISNYILCDFLC